MNSTWMHKGWLAMHATTQLDLVGNDGLCLFLNNFMQTDVAWKGKNDEIQCLLS